MKVFITLQRHSNRGVRCAFRMNGTQYAFDWNPALRVYARPVTNLQEANRLLENITQTRMFTPGLAILEDAGAPMETLAESAAPVPAAVPVIETPSATAIVDVEKADVENEEPVLPPKIKRKYTRHTV